MGLETLDDLEARVDLKGCSCIGTGSLSEVIRAKERTTGMGLAVKLVGMGRLAQTGTSEARIRREVKTLCALDHPNIVRLIHVLSCRRKIVEAGVRMEPPYLCICMQEVSGAATLNSVIKAGPLQPIVIAAILPQLASALAYMHEQGFVHRDIWAENVLISGGEKVVLADLGCAESYRSGPAAVTEKLNVPYTSPEAAAGMPQSPAEDCWALGLLLTEMVTGRFVRERLGRTDIPIHANVMALSQAIRDTHAMGGPRIGRMATSLLGNLAVRMTMRSVVTESTSIYNSFQRSRRSSH